MAEKIDYGEVMSRIKGDVDYVAEEAYNKGYEQAKMIWSSKTNEESYQRGLSEGNDIGYKDGVKDGQNEAWEVAKKLFSTMAESDIEKAFPIEWNSGGFKALMNLQPQEAIAKLKAYEEKQKADDKIEAGDEVKPFYTDITGVVTLIDGDTIYVLWRDGSSTSVIKLKEVRKTGRHFDIEKILEAMKHD